MHANNKNLTEGSIFRKMVAFAIPFLLTGMVQRLFNVADVVLASWLGTSGNDVVAAVGSTTALTNLMIGFFVGCSSGSAVTVSHALGRGREEEIQKTVHTAILLAVVLGGVLTVLGLGASEWMLRMMGTPAHLLSLSAAYLRAYFMGMIPCMVYHFGAAILRAVGETQKPFYFLLISGPIKLLLTVLFVAGWNLDVTGLALATTCSQVVAAGLVLLAMMKRRDVCRVELRMLRLHPKPLKKILQLGIPAGIQSATFSLSGVVIQSSVNSLSDLEGFLAGNAAAVSIEGFADAVSSTYFQTGLVFVGQNIGAGKMERVKKGFWQLGLLSFGFSVFMSLAVCLFSEPLLALYLKGEPAAIHWGTVRILYFFLPFFLQGLMDATAGCIRGFGISFSTMVISLVGVCGFRIAWMFTAFQWIHTPQCLYLSYPISWAITYIAEWVLYKIVCKKHQYIKA